MAVGRDTPLATPLDGAMVKKDFPIFRRDKPFVYLDSAASSQKPKSMLDAMDRYYETTNANVHRGVYQIAERATAMFEDARSKLARFVGAAAPREIVFTKNGTEGINLVAQS
nr:aminotransferase class V-fold PLP-dependent enzyme [Actinomycetota bacterium]